MADASALPPDETGPFEDRLDRHERQGMLDGRIVVSDWAGGIAEERAEVPSLRIGRRWWTTLWLIPIAAVGLVLAVAVAREVRQYDWMRSFIERYPGTSADYVPDVTDGFPWWLRWQHFFNLLFMMFIIRAGLQILADHPRLYFRSGCEPGTEWLRMRGPVPPDRQDPRNPTAAWTAKDDSVALPRWLGLPGFRHSIGLARWWHFGFDLLWLVNGAIFFVLLFSTGQWERLVPRSLAVFPNAASTAVQYLSLQFPVDRGFTAYNGLQILAYFLTVFVAAPLAFATGLLQAPAIAAKLGTGHGALNRQIARSVHFGVLVWMVVFIAMHTLMVFTTGAVRNLNHITLGTDTESYWALAIAAAATIVVVVLWVRASPFTITHPRVVQRVGARTVGWIAALMEWGHPTATYGERDISPFLWPNGHLPDSERYRALRDADWDGFSLRIEGLVEKPTDLSLAAIKALPKHEQITQHYCIQGWSGIAKWGGASMSDILDLVQPLPEAKWVVFYSFGEGPETPGTGLYYDCHRIEHMRHEQSILAYEMNDEPLLEVHGAPLRLRNELELGFKQVKWVQAIELVASFEHLGAGQGGYNEDQEFFGYRVPI
ncbi:MAG TPA: molybdopterin-dependent oxidoreductase [Microthrixaceae bacterium]|nr:molybdopterin-dependent oxidoreductase [Microthrixaceae bacterium]